MRARPALVEQPGGPFTIRDVEIEALDIMTVRANGTRIRGVIEGDATPGELIPRLVELHRQGRLPIEKLVAAYPFADIETAARDAAAGKVVKPVLTFE